MSDLPKKINLNYIDQVTYLQGMHRSGWPFVLSYLYKLQSDDGVLCDTYVDRTFLWGATGQIPYTRPWIGFIHHTFDTSFSSYNNVTLLKNDNFLASLPHCKGLFIFSERSQSKWKRQIQKLGYSIPVKSLIHPTKFVDTRFTMTKFKKNPNRSIVQVGAWLRDNYAIYRLNNGNPSFTLENGTVVKKAALIGPKMEHYYKPFDFFRHFRPTKWKYPEIVPSVMWASTKPTADAEPEEVKITSINGELPKEITSPVTDNVGEDGMSTGGMCRDIMCRDADFGLNKYVLGAINMLSKYDESVVTYTQMSNEEYDNLFSENIVFIKLVDAAAVNTLQECVVRNTPIVVNPLPAIVEILGSGYPLYFDNLSDVPELITLENIRAAYDYLVNMDKDSLKIVTFMSEIVNSDIYKSL